MRGRFNARGFEISTALDALSPQQRHQFESSVSPEIWIWLWNLPVASEQQPESVLVVTESEPVLVDELAPVPQPAPVDEPESVPQPAPVSESELVPEPESVPQPALVDEPESPPEPEPEPVSVSEPTLEELKALLLACDSLVQLNEIKRKHSKTVTIAYDSMSAEEQSRVDALAALSVPHKVFKYMGDDEIKQGTQRLIKGTLVYLDPKAQVKATAYNAEVWAINGVASGWKRPISVSVSLLLEVVKVVLPDEIGGGQQMGFI